MMILHTNFAVNIARWLLGKCRTATVVSNAFRKIQPCFNSRRSASIKEFEETISICARIRPREFEFSRSFSTSPKFSDPPSVTPPPALADHLVPGAWRCEELVKTLGTKR